MSIAQGADALKRPITEGETRENKAKKARGEAHSFASLYEKSTDGSIPQVKVSLQSAKVTSFKILVDYLYHDDCSLRATLPAHTTTIIPFINAWTLADRLKMEDAKNSIMNRIRRVITSISQTHMFTGGQSSESMVRTALVFIQNTGTKYGRDCQVRNLLVDRMAFDMVDSSTALTEGKAPRLIPAVQEIFNKGGQSAADVLTQYFVIKSSPDPAAQLDPAGLIGCHYHVHTPGQTSRVCFYCNSRANLFNDPPNTSIQTSAPPSSASISSALNFEPPTANTITSSQSASGFGSGLFTPQSSQLGQQQKATATVTQQDTKTSAAHEATRPLFDFGSGSSSANGAGTKPVSADGVKAESYTLGKLPSKSLFGRFPH